MPNKRGRSRRQMTIEEAEAALFESRKAAAREALSKELAVSVPIAALLLGLSKQHAYDLIKEKTFPLPTIKLGRTFRVPTRALREALQVQEASPQAAA
jgi:excisionase family DNA binding protein